VAAAMHLDYMLADCFFAVGQAVGDQKHVEYDAIVWLRDRYREKFHHAITVLGNSWDDDRTRVMAVSRWLGHQAVSRAGDQRSIDQVVAAAAAAEIEAGCAMSARRNP
jgi:hypothetical protein